MKSRLSALDVQLADLAKEREELVVSVARAEEHVQSACKIKGEIKVALKESGKGDIAEEIADKLIAEEFSSAETLSLLDASCLKAMIPGLSFGTCQVVVKALACLTK